MGVLRAVIPAAGLGTRLYPATKSQPKEMLPLGTKPTIHLVAEELIEAGLQDLLIVIGGQKRAIADHFDKADGLCPQAECDRCDEVFDNPHVHYFYTRQSIPKGLGDAVMHARPFVGQDTFVVALGDCVIVGPERSSLMKRALETHERQGAAATIAVQRVPAEATSRYGIVDFEGPGEGVALRLRDIVEKPGPERAPSNLAVCARYVFSPVLFDYLERTAPGYGGEVQLTDAIGAMIHDGLPVYAVPLLESEERLDVGNFESYARAFIRVMLCHEELGPRLREYTSGLIDRLDG